MELSEESLLVANFGQPFGGENVRALRRLHKTTKKMGGIQDEMGVVSQSKRIGHKGIGFKSVLEITSRPEVYSDIYAFGFDVSEFQKDVGVIIDDVDDWTLPIFRVPYPRFINQLPLHEREKIERLFDNGFVTVIRLPFDSEESAEEVALRIEQDIQPDLLLFMSAISRIEIHLIDGSEFAYERKVGSVGDTGFEMVCLTRHDDDGANEVSQWLTLQATIPIMDRSLVSGLGEAWKDVDNLGFMLAFPSKRHKNGADSDGLLSGHEGSEPFHVYYPTHEYSGMAFKIHGDFYVGDSRKSIPPDKPINRWLMDEICNFLTGHGLESLKRQWPHDAELVYRLIPITRPEGPFAWAFMETYLKMLRITPFVPIPGKNYKSPENVRLPPREVEQALFKALFPPAHIRGTKKWAYPIDEITRIEFARCDYVSQHSDAVLFLQRPELGCEPVTIETVVAALSKNGMPPIGDSGILIGALADWYSELRKSERQHFLSQVESLPIFPTVSGWRKPGTELVFQANLREEIDEETLPGFFKVSVMRRSVYPAERGATSSNQYQFFEALRARDFSRRSIILEAVLPILTDEDKFATLQSEDPNAIFQAYNLLREYFEDGGTTRDFEQRLTQIPVPTTTDGSWRVAGECFFGASWPAQNGKILERVFGLFSGNHFLDDIPQLEIEDDEDRIRWADYFLWLGVSDHPRIITSNRRITRGSRVPLSNLLLWDGYIESHEQDFRCPNPAAHHGYSRGLDGISAIENFDILVQEGDRQKLIDLFVLLANFWETHYKMDAHSRIACDRQTCMHDDIESYLFYQIQNSPWIPAKVSDTWISPLSPKQIWSLGETEPGDVRMLVPNLPDELRKPEYHEFIAALGFVTSSNAGIEDFVRLLQLMPEKYPVAPEELPEDEHRRWQRSLNAVFNWICERIQTGLVSRGDDTPSLPCDLKILAYYDDRPHYVSLGSPELVYPDNPFLADRWSKQCAYLRINDDWRRLRTWLDVPNLSEIVSSQWMPDGELEQASEKLNDVYKEILPYYLALIKYAQPANYDRLVPRLLRLKLCVVKNLSVEERLLPLPDVLPLKHHVLVHLEKREEPNPGAGRQFVIAGTLYIAKEAANNPDLLGEYLADYIEIARLGDAFVLLMSRSTVHDRWRFLESKGIKQDILVEVVADIQERSTFGEENITGLTIQEMLDRITDSQEIPEIPPTPSISSASSGVNGDEIEQDGNDTENQGERSEPTTPEYPELDLTNLPGVQSGSVVGVEQPDDGNGKRRKGGSSGSGRGHIPRQEITEELGKRGEKWAYENEKLRLQNEYGLNPAELEEGGKLVWVSFQNPTANHDIRSISISERGEMRTIYIEVKASTGDVRKIKMSRQEFQLAMSLGSEYWLYWVANVDEAKPDPPVCYKNVAQLVADKRITIDVGTLDLTLPEIIREEDSDESIGNE